MESRRWISRVFQKDKLRYRERYQNRLEDVKIPDSAKTENALILIPDGQFLRKYLRFLEEIMQHHKSFDRIKHFTLIILESAAEVMDYRNSSPSISLNDKLSKESAAINERRRITKLWQDNNADAGQSEVTVCPFADLSVIFDSEEGGEDDFDIFDYANMAVKDRSRCALLRAAQMISLQSGLSGAKIVLLSQDELLLESNTKDTNASIQTMDCTDFIKFLLNLCIGANEEDKGFITEHWEQIEQSCQEQYIRRNIVVPAEEESIFTDNFGHFEYFPEPELEQGIKQKKVFRSVLKVSNENPKEAFCFVRASDGSNVKYYLNELNGHFNRSIHEDAVVIEPLPSEQWEEPIGRHRLVHISSSDTSDESDKGRLKETKSNVVPTARVVGLHKSNQQRRKFVATMIPITGVLRREENYIFVVPMDYKIPRIRIKTRMQHEKIVNKRLLIEIDGWDVESMCPHGHFVQILGDVGDLDTEISCLLREHSIDLSPFSANALACLPPVGETGWKIDNEEISNRRDLRKLCRIFSVDPVGCQDIDDTMHARELPNGDIEVGVHIADVTYFVKHNSALDKEAARRATTFYLVDRRFDMLPSLLSSDLCSLHDNVDRLAVSVIWTLSSDLETVKSVWYGRTVIHNVQAMTYEQAHNILHDVEPEGKGYTLPPKLTAGGPVDKGSISGLKKDLSVLTKLARKLRKRRENSGSVDLSSGDRGSELKFVLDSSGNPTKVMPKKELEIHHTIAELMILANSFVAETIYNHFPDASLLRVHGYAKVDNFDELDSLMRASGIAFDGSSNKSLARSLNEARKKGAGSINDSLFQSLATRAMSEAQYICTGDYDDDSGLSHYGLGIGFYTHFTSPIRRFADVIVHRLLTESLLNRDSIEQPSALPSSAPNSLIPESNAISVLQGDGVKHKSNALDLGSDDLLDEDDDFLDSLIEGAEDLALGFAKTDKKDVDYAEKTANASNLKNPKALYETTELAKTCNVLNSQNRIAKLSSMQCQRLFLSLFFRERTEVTQAIVVGLKQNGLIVYVPKYDMKGPVFLSDRDGNIQVDPALCGLPSTSGLPPSSGFTSLKNCKMFPDGRCSLKNEYSEEKSTVEVELPGGKSVLSFRRLSVVTVQLSCDFSNAVARVPNPSLHLVSMDKRRKVESIASTEPTKRNTVLGKSQPTSTFSPSPERANALSMFHVFSSIPVNTDLMNVPPRFSTSNSKKVKDRVQTIKGRIYLNGFKADVLQPELIDQGSDFGQPSLTDQARIGDFEASRSIEREATSRMQRIAAERRNAKKSKAMKRK